MKKILAILLVTLTFIGCSSDSNETVVHKLVVNQSLKSLKLSDQNGNIKSISPDTKKIVFAFSKDIGHKCNKFFTAQPDSYFKDNKIQFIADISSAPSLIKKMFVLPGLKDFKHTVLVMDNRKLSAEYKPSAKYDDKIVVADIKNQIITSIKYFNSTDELKKYIGN